MKRESLTDLISDKKLSSGFFLRDVLYVAPELIGKIFVIRSQSSELSRFMITETEAYRGYEDKACHASRGRTKRNEIMYHSGGKIYIYFVYGMYWMLNIVTGPENNPQAALIRGIEGYSGPGRLTKALGIDKAFYGDDLTISDLILL